MLSDVQTKSQEIEDKISRYCTELKKKQSEELCQLSQPITLEGIQKLIPANAALVEILHFARHKVL